jgi:DNA polymerase
VLYCTIKQLKNQGNKIMPFQALRDLELAGVKWELAETPITTKNIQQNKPAGTQQNNNLNEILKTQANLVPPIAPAQTISVETVRAMADRPTDMESLKRMITEFNHPLRASATNTVLPHVGNGKMLILTDIPSSDDDASGQILTGTAGDLMDKMLGAIGLGRNQVSIVPMIFWRTPGGRTPSRTELDMARPFVNKAIELIKPKVILSLGTLPATEMQNINLAKSHGTPVTMDNNIIFVPIYHPNYLILKPAAKRDVWNALQNVQNILKSDE